MLVLVVLGLALLPVVLTRSIVVRAIVLPRIEAELGADVRADRLVIEPDARIVASGVEVRIRGVDGPAAQLLTADGLEIVSSWGDILSGSGRFSEIILTRPRLRVSRDARSGEINLAELRAPDRPSGAGSAGGGPPPPRIVVREGTVELGEQTDQGWSLLRTLRVEGSASPTPAAEGAGYELAFKEGAVSDAEGRGLGLTGRITPGGFELKLDGLEFGQWRPEHIPSDYRDVFELMQIEGGVPTASMSVKPDGSTEGLVELDGVSLNLPFDIEGKAADRDNLVRLRDVTGTVRVNDDGAVAKLEGLLGDLPAVVELTYKGLDADSPFSCTIDITGFRLTSEPEVMPLAPAIVVKRLNDFSNPTAMVDASVTLERAVPSAGGPGPITVRGDLKFRDGTATFRDFPYRFEQMTGLATFDEEKIEIVGIDAVAPSGARLHTTGWIAPPLPGAAVGLKVIVEGAPIDDTLLEAMGERRRGIVEALCSRERFDALRNAGLLPRDRSFTLGGLASVELDIAREFGEETDYTEIITVRLPEVGLVPEPFPLPIIARDLEIKIEEGEALITGGSFAGLSGGRARVDARVDLSKPNEEGVELSIEAHDVPADALLLAALPGGLDETPAERSPSEVLRRLGVSGYIDCTAEIGPREGGELGYDIEVSLAGLEASPRHDEQFAAAPIALGGIEGRLLVSEHDLALDMRASVSGTAEDAPSGDLSLKTELALGDVERPFTAEIDATIPDISIAFEDLVSVVAPAVAGQLAELRGRSNPTGGVVLIARVAGDAGDEATLTRLDIEARRCDGFAFDHVLGRLGVTSSDGVVAFSALQTESAVFDDWSARLTLDGQPACDLTLTGHAPYKRDWRGEDDLKVAMRDARLESPLVRHATSGALPPGLADAANRAALIGVFDADLRVRGRESSLRPGVTGEVRPRSCELTVASQRVSVTSMAGGIILDEAGGSFQQFGAEGDGWWVRTSGEWVSAGADGAVIVECALDAASEQGLTDEVSALLPAAVRRALGAISLTVTAPVSAEGVKLRLTLDDGVSHEASGRVIFEGADADVGVEVRDASGYLDFVAESLPGHDLASFGIGILLDAAQVANIHLRDGMVRVASDPGSGVVLVPVVQADAYGGRLTGTAVIHPDAAGESVYDGEFRLSGVPLGELLADWEHAAGIERAAEAQEEAPERREAEARGTVDAGLTLTGTLGDTASRRGRGMVIAGDEDTPVLRLPILLPLIEVSNLQVPSNETLDFGEAVFYLDGDRVVLERVGVFAQSVEIFGFGQMTLPGLELDLRISSRAVDRLPILSDLIERFRDELVTTRVRGTAGSPEVSLEPFARTRRLFSGAVGRELSEGERRMLEIERLSRESAKREWRVPKRAGSEARPGG